MIIAYTGLPGGGKSLSAIADYVLPELRRGRHVFCNIAGLSPLMVAAKLSSKGNVVSTSYVNFYLHRFSVSFNDDEAADLKSFRRVLGDGSVCYFNMEGLVILIGEVMSYNEKGSEPVVILDECHEYLAPENWRALRPFASYVSMARHYGHDLVLITQHIGDIWEPLQRRVHETHDFVRGRLGLRSQYMERVYHGCNIYVPPGYTRSRFNDKGLYALYSSHDCGAKEHLGYISIWKNRKLVALVLLAVFLFSFSAYGLRDGLFGGYRRALGSSSSAASMAPEYSLNANVIFVKYVVCGSFDCRATRPDGSVLILPLDYNSGRYPLEVRKYVPSGSSSFVPGFGGSRPAGVPNAPR
jgi:zona occludens toxin (predicted ATPase)